MAFYVSRASEAPASSLLYQWRPVRILQGVAPWPHGGIRSAIADGRGPLRGEGHAENRVVRLRNLLGDLHLHWRGKPGRDPVPGPQRGGFLPLARLLDPRRAATSGRDRPVP